MSFPGVKPVFGAGVFGFGHYSSDEEFQQVYDRLQAGGCDTLDTAAIYGNSEERIGDTKGGEKFKVDSKTPGGLLAGSSTRAGVLTHVQEGLKKSGLKQFDVYYIHAPDPSVPIEDTLAGIQDAYKAGLFRRFGLSNYIAEQVRQVVEICKAKGYVVPTVYQGNYNAVARGQETQLIPTLRELGFAFYAYSPVAGGFLTKTYEQVMGTGSGGGRFTASGPLTDMYQSMYAQPSMLEALKRWTDIVPLAGASSRAELAFRWIIFDSALSDKYGDRVIFGSSSPNQVEETLSWFKKGSVGPEAKKQIDDLWELVKDEAILNNISSEGKPSYLSKKT